MKNKNKFFLAAIAMIAFASSVNAQATASSPASATIVTPISIANNVDMNFGNIAVQVANGGTVILSAASAPTRTLTGTGLTLPTVTGTVSSAKFTVSGTANYTYVITLPSSATLASGGNSMGAANFTHSAAGTLSGLGSEIFYVGAELTVAANQAAGTYTTATPFDVTVNYN